MWLGLARLFMWACPEENSIIKEIFQNQVEPTIGVHFQYFKRLHTFEDIYTTHQKYDVENDASKESSKHASILMGEQLSKFGMKIQKCTWMLKLDIID